MGGEATASHAGVDGRAHARAEARAMRGAEAGAVSPPSGAARRLKKADNSFIEHIHQVIAESTPPRRRRPM